jgi:dienelactone hydrolase
MKPFSLLAGSLLFVTCSLAFGQDPTPTPYPYQTELFAYAQDGTPLNWDVYQPATQGQKPVVLVLHIGAFKGGTREDYGVIKAAGDLARAGFIACAIDYRLDILGHLAGQVRPAFADGIGQIDVQINDVRKAILAARSPLPGSVIYGQVTGRVGGVGGSAGASHVLSCAATGTQAQRFDAAVMLSGPYAFDDHRSLAAMYVPCPGTNPTPTSFASDSLGFCLRFPNLHDGSPLYKVTSTVVPLLFFASEHDPITPPQYTDLTQWLSTIQPPPDAESYLVRGDAGCKHAFDYYEDQVDSDTQGSPVVNDLINTWLWDHLSSPGRKTAARAVSR